MIETARIRQLAWEHAGVPYNPDAAFARAARVRGLGAPVTLEVREADTVLQGFFGGILVTEEGHWDLEEIQTIGW